MLVYNVLLQRRFVFDLWKNALRTWIEGILHKIIGPAFDHDILNNSQYKMQIVITIIPAYVLLINDPSPMLEGVPRA